MKAAEGRSLIVLPGMELETEEEAHVVCLFPDLSSAAAFEGALGPYFNTDLKNNPSIYGDQLIMSETDEILGTEERLLSAATRLSVDHSGENGRGLRRALPFPPTSTGRLQRPFKFGVCGAGNGIQEPGAERRLRRRGVSAKAPRACGLPDFAELRRALSREDVAAGSFPRGFRAQPAGNHCSA